MILNNKNMIRFDLTIVTIYITLEPKVQQRPDLWISPLS